MNRNEAEVGSRLRQGSGATGLVRKAVVPPGTLLRAEGRSRLAHCWGNGALGAPSVPIHRNGYHLLALPATRIDRFGWHSLDEAAA